MDSLQQTHGSVSGGAHAATLAPRAGQAQQPPEHAPRARTLAGAAVLARLRPRRRPRPGAGRGQDGGREGLFRAHLRCHPQQH